MNGMVVKDAKNDWYEQRRRIKTLIGYLEADDQTFRRKNAEEAAKALRLLYERTEYLNVAQWIGSDCMAMEQERRRGFFLFSWWRTRKLRRRIRQNLRRIAFGPSEEIRRK